MEPEDGLAAKKALDRVEQTFGEKIDTNSKKLDKNSRQLDKNSRKFDELLIQLIKNGEAINKMVTREEFNEFRRDFLSREDKIMAILIRLDQQRIFTAGSIRGIEGDVEAKRAE